jgi:galactokinase
MNVDELKTAFAKMFGRSPSGVVAAPGRVNLIGEHTDYNDGYVLPIAIELATWVTWAPRDDGRLALASLQQPGREIEVDLCEPILPGEPAWSNYPKGVAAMLAKAGLALPACSILFSSNVPIGSGLSSSASLEVATGLALLAAAGQDMDRYELAKLCQAAEHAFPEVPCGIMDQAISALGRADHALLLDCRDGSTQQIPFDDPDAVVLVADTQVAHELSDGGYAARRQQCHTAAEKLGLAALRDADLPALEAGRNELTDIEFRRARHVVTEIARTLQAVDALKDRDMPRFGELMYASHASLRDDYDVSCEELDAMVESARGCEGTFGARMTGGGFGGCAIALVRSNQAQAVAETIAADYEDRFGRRCPVFATPPAAGARIVE